MIQEQLMFEGVKEIIHNVTTRGLSMYKHVLDYVPVVINHTYIVSSEIVESLHNIDDHVILYCVWMMAVLCLCIVTGFVCCKVKSGSRLNKYEQEQDFFISLCDIAKTAFTTGQTDRVIQLVDTHTVDINQPLSPNGLTVFLSSCLSGNKRLINHLLSKGGDIKHRTNAGDTCLYLATYAVINHGYTDYTVLQDLMLAGCDVNGANKCGYVPLHRAAGGGRVEIIKLLLKYGASPYKCSVDGIYPVDIAVNNGHVEAARLLQVRVYNPYVWDVIEPHTPPHIKLGLQSPKKHHLVESSRHILSPVLKARS